MDRKSSRVGGLIYLFNDLEHACVDKTVPAFTGADIQRSEQVGDRRVCKRVAYYLVRPGSSAPTAGCGQTPGIGRSRRSLTYRCLRRVQLQAVYIGEFLFEVRIL